MRLIANCEPAIQWVGDRLGIKDFGPCSALGIADGNILIGGVVFNNYRYPNIEATIATSTPKWCNRSILRGIFHVSFEQYDCTRLTAVVESTNQPTQAFLCKIGFLKEGVMRRAFPSGNDAVIYGLLREECRWLEQRKPHVEIGSKCPAEHRPNGVGECAVSGEPAIGAAPISAQ